MAASITQPITTVVSSVYSFVASWSSYLYQKCSWNTQPNVADSQNAQRDAARQAERLETLVTTGGQTEDLEKDRVDDKARNALQLQHSARANINGATGDQLEQERQRLNQALLAVNSDPVSSPVVVDTQPRPATGLASNPMHEEKTLVASARELASKIGPKFDGSVVLGELERCADLLETEATPRGNPQKLAGLKGQLARKMLALTEEYDRALKMQQYVLEQCQQGLEDAYSRLEPLRSDSSLASTGFNPQEVKKRLQILGEELKMYASGTVSVPGASRLLRKIEDIVEELRKLAKADSSEAAFDDIASYAAGRTRKLATPSGVPWDATIRILPAAWMQIRSGDGNAEQILGILRENPIPVIKDGTQKGQRVLKYEDKYGWIFSTSSNLRLRANTSEWPPKTLHFDDTHKALH